MCYIELRKREAKDTAYPNNKLTVIQTAVIIAVMAAIFVSP